MCEHCYEKVDDGQTHALSDSNIDLNDQSNWNCEILSRDERGEPKCLMKNLSKQGRQPASEYEIKLRLSLSAKRCRNPCSTHPTCVPGFEYVP